MWETFQDFDKNADGKLDATEMRAALSRSNIDISPSTAEDLVRLLAGGGDASASSSSSSSSSSSGSGAKGSIFSSSTKEKEKDKSKDAPGMFITFAEFRDFLIMLPRKATPFEIYKCEWGFTLFGTGVGGAKMALALFGPAVAWSASASTPDPE